MSTSRRRLLRAAGIAALLAGCERALPSPSPRATTMAPPTAASTPLVVSPPRPTGSAPGRVALRVGRLIEARPGTNEANAVLLLRGDRFDTWTPRDSAPDLRDADVVDLPGLTAIPAMVDCHVHLTGSGGTNAHQALQDPDDVLLARAEANARLAAKAGVLGVRDVGAVAARSGDRLYAMNLKARDALRGAMDAPYIVAAGCWLAKRGRYAPFSVQVDSAQELLRVAIAQLDAGADLVKIASDHTTGGPATWTVSELRPVVDAVHARGKKVAAHSQGHGARVAAEAGVDTIEHGFTIDEATAQAMRGKVLVTSLSVAQAFGQLEGAAASLRRAYEAGVTIAVGTDAGGAPPVFGDYAQEVELMITRGGMSPGDALAAATRTGGKVLGVPGLGTFDPGAPAHVVLVDGDPYSDPRALRNVRAVFRGGKRLV